MFLSHSNSEYTTDGSLIVDLADDNGPRLRFGAYEKGMLWEEWRSSGWRYTERDYGVIFANRSHNLRQELPVLDYLASIPEPIIEALYGIPHCQATMLKFCAYWNNAADLLLSNRILFWLLADRYARDSSIREEFPWILDLPQRSILKTLLSREVAPVEVRFLKKIDLSFGDIYTLREIQKSLAKEGLANRLAHWKRVPPILLSAFALSAPLARLQWINKEVSTQAALVDNHFANDNYKLLTDTVLLINQSNRNHELILECTNWEDVRALHDRLLHPPAPYKLAVDAGKVFPDPPVPGNKYFSPIRTGRELIEEGEKMHHCVATRTQNILAGRSCIYKVNLEGERGTIEIRLTPDGAPHYIEQFKLACNKEPSPGTWFLAQQWLMKSRQIFHLNEKSKTPKR